MEWYHFPILIVGGFIAGFINMAAGSGSLITLPLLMWVGVPANVANGTNRIAVLLQDIVGVSRFARKGALDVTGTAWLAGPIIVGALIGARIAVTLSAVAIQYMIGGLMVFMLIVLLAKPDRWLRETVTTSPRRPTWVHVILYFGLGLYGGFLQAGIGVFMLATLVLGSGYDLVRGNAVKTALILCITVFSLPIFIWHGEMRWGPGLVLAIGQMSGAWVGAHETVRRGAPFVRWFLIGVVLFAAIWFLGLKNLIG